ncbi:hypothetical protein [Mycoplasma mycoides]|nr:hypothetical protein [Mycoplasma mycoides]
MFSRLSGKRRKIIAKIAYIDNLIINIDFLLTLYMYILYKL